MSGFTFCGVSSDSLGLTVLTKRFPLLPERVTVTEEIAGRSGVLDYSFSPIHGYPCYRERVIELECAFVNRSPIKELLASLRSVMQTFLQRGKLTLHNDPKVYYMAYVENTAELERELRTVGRFTLCFRCEPFGYGAEITRTLHFSSLIKQISLYQEGCYPIWPKILPVSAPTGMSLTIGSRTLTLPTDRSCSLIDCEKMRITDENGNAVSGYAGQFPYLLPGLDRITIAYDEEAVSSVQMQISYTPLYL